MCSSVCGCERGRPRFAWRLVASARWTPIDGPCCCDQQGGRPVLRQQPIRLATGPGPLAPDDRTWVVATGRVAQLVNHKPTDGAFATRGTRKVSSLPRVRARSVIGRRASGAPAGGRSAAARPRGAVEGGLHGSL